MKKLPLLFFVCLCSLAYAQDPASKTNDAPPATLPDFGLPKTTEPIYMVNDSTVITAEQFKAINPHHIQSIEVRRYNNSIVEAHSEAERRGVVVIYLKNNRSFSDEFLQRKNNSTKN